MAGVEGKLLSNIPQPLQASFTGWTEFEIHLASLEYALPALRKAEAEIEAIVEGWE